MVIQIKNGFISIILFASLMVSFPLYADGNGQAVNDTDATLYLCGGWSGAAVATVQPHSVQFGMDWTDQLDEIVWNASSTCDSMGSICDYGAVGLSDGEGVEISSTVASGTVTFHCQYYKNGNVTQRFDSISYSKTATEAGNLFGSILNTILDAGSN